jgi:RNA polymerase sigma factor (sigma-70 family)
MAGPAASSFETLVAAHVDLVYGAAMRQVRDPHIADDVTQAVFLVMARKIDRLPAAGALPAWLLKVTRYTALTALRGDRRRRRHEQAAGVQAQHTQTPAEHDQQIAALLDEALMSLAERDRQLIVLRYMRGMSLAETALALSLRSNTAAKRVERALARMRRHFQRRGVVTSSAGLAVALPALRLRAAPVHVAPAVIKAVAAGGAAAVPGIAAGVPLGVWLMTVSAPVKIAAALAVLLTVLAGTYALTHAAKAAAPGVAASPAPAPPPAAGAGMAATGPSGEIFLQFKVAGEDGHPAANIQLLIMEDYANFPVVNPGQEHWRDSATTGPDGIAKITAPRAMRLNIFAQDDAHAPLFLHSVEPHKQAIFPVALVAGHTVKGVVKDDHGDPLGGVTVKVEPQELAMMFLYNAVKPVITARNGTFELPHMTEGRYTLTTQMPDDAAEWSASPIDLAVDAGPAEIPLEIKAVAGITLRGEVIAPAGLDLTKYDFGVSVRIPKSGRIVGKINDDKTFEIRGVPPESIGSVYFSEAREYAPIITWKDAPPEFKLKNAQIDFGYARAGTYSGVRLELLQFATATGRALDEAGKPVPGEWFIEPAPSNRLFRPDAEGKYTARIIPRTRSRLQVVGQSIVENQQTDWITAEPGATIEQNFTVKRIVKPPHEQSIAGKVVDADGKPVALDSLRAVAGNNSIDADEFYFAGQKQVTWTGGGTHWPLSTPVQGGSFNFDQLVAGATDVWVIDAKAGFGAFLPAVKTGTRNALLAMHPIEPRVRWSGQILDAAGAPASNARVMMLLPETVGNTSEYAQPALLAEARTDAQGRFNVEGVPRFATYPELRLIALPEKGAMAWKFLPRMSIDNLKIQLKPEGEFTGKVLTPAGEPVAGAEVKVGSAYDSDFGRIVFSTRSDFAVAQLPVKTDARGQYRIRGFPADAQIGLGASAAGYGAAAGPRRASATTKDPIDIELAEGVTLEGDVRLANGQPVAGAQVTGHGQRDFGPATTDARGHYVMAGVDRFAILDPYFVLSVKAGDGKNLLEGTQRYTYSLYPGDHILHLDVKVDLALSARQLAWMAAPVARPAPAPGVALLEDRDETYRDQPAYHDTLTLIGPAGKALWQIATLNSTSSLAQVHKLANDPKSHATWICAGTGGLVHINAAGAIDWQKPNLRANAVAIDPATSNAWLSTSGEIQVVDATGSMQQSYPLQCNDIVYSSVEKCFWIKGRGVQKISTTGDVLAQATVTFPATAPALAVNESDGTVWVSEQLHPQVSASKDRLLHLSRDGQVLKEIPVAASGLAIDGKRRVLWVCGSSAASPELTRMSFDGAVEQRVPVGTGFLALEPETGCVWAATRDAVFRISADGGYVSQIKSEGSWQKWLALLPG